MKSQGTNTIEIADGVRRTVAELMKGGVPSDVHLDIVRDTSRGIRSSVDNVQRTLIEGGLLTIAIVFLFLHSWRSTIITGLALPVSVLGAAITFTCSIRNPLVEGCYQKTGVRDQGSGVGGPFRVVRCIMNP